MQYFKELFQNEDNKDLSIIAGGIYLPREIVYKIASFLIHQDIKSFFLCNSQLFTAIGQMPTKLPGHIKSFSFFEVSRQKHQSKLDKESILNNISSSWLIHSNYMKLMLRK